MLFMSKFRPSMYRDNEKALVDVAVVYCGTEY